MKLDDFFSVTARKRGKKTVDLLDEDGSTCLLRVDDTTTDTAIVAIMNHFRRLLREKDWTPALVEYRGHRKMVYFTRAGWQVNRVDTMPNGITSYVNEICYVEDGYATRRLAERAARRQLAQDAWQPGETESAVLFPDDTEGRREFESWARWQNAYKEAEAQGMYEEAARQYADNWLIANQAESRLKPRLAEGPTGDPPGCTCGGNPASFCSACLHEQSGFYF
jgi:hypothetical protein